MRRQVVILGALLVCVGLVGVARSSAQSDESAAPAKARGPMMRHMNHTGDGGPLGAEIQALRAAAHDQIRALLTPEQQAQFDALKPPAEGPKRMAGMRPEGRGGPGDKPMRAGRAGGPGGEGGEMLLERMTERLSLTEEQQSAIKTILDSARTAREARVAQAQADFRAILTAEQAAKLDEQKATKGDARRGGFGGQRRGGPEGGGALQLTDDQKTQADGIFSKLRTDLEQMRTETRAQVEGQLTDSQKALLRPAPPADGGRECGRGKPVMGHGGPGGPGGPGTEQMLAHLTKALNLTEEQQAGVKSILEKTKAEIRAKLQEAHPVKVPGATSAPAAMVEKTTTPQGTDE